MKRIVLSIAVAFGLMFGLTIAQETGGVETGGMETGSMGMDQDLFSETQDILADPASASVTAAVANIEAWQERLRGAGDDSLTAVADQLEILKTELQADSPDSAAISSLLADLAEATQQAAQGATGDTAQQLNDLASQLGGDGGMMETGGMDMEETGGMEMETGGTETGG